MNDAKVMFNPDDISKADCKKLAGCIEDYLNLYTEVMVVPKELTEQFNGGPNSIKLVKELIDKLKDGKINKCFNDMKHWQDL